MAIMYARPTLTSWDLSVSGGWSNTSGGVSNGTVPGNTTDVIFDANSGAARTITLSDINTVGTPLCKTITTTGSSGMTFVSSGTATSLTMYGNVDLSSTASFGAVLTFASSASLSSPSTPIGDIIGAVGVGLVTLSSDITVTNSISMNTTNFNANNFNVTAGSFSIGTATVTMGIGTWTLTGSGNPWSVASGTTVVPSTSTIKLTYNGALAVSFSGFNKTYYNFWNATSGACVVTNSGSCTYNNFRIDAGRTQKFSTTVVTTVSSFTADGTGGQITIDSSTTVAMTLTKAGGGSVYCDNVSIAHCTGLPVSTWNARSSVNGGSNTNWNFIPPNRAFLQFC